MRIRHQVLLLIGAVVLAGCMEAQPPKQPPEVVVTEIAAKTQTAVAEKKPAKLTISSLPPVRKDRARLVVYRTQFFGLAVQPIVRVDGKETHRCTPNVAFVVDVAPGVHTLSGETEVTANSTVNIAPGTTAYVNCSISTGLLIGRLTFSRVSESEALAKGSKVAVKAAY